MPKKIRAWFALPLLHLAGRILGNKGRQKVVIGPPHQTRKRYVPSSNAGTWNDILTALRTNGSMTAQQLNTVLGRQTCSLFLPAMVQAGVVSVDKTGRRFTYTAVA